MSINDPRAQNFGFLIGDHITSVNDVAVSTSRPPPAIPEPSLLAQRSSWRRAGFGLHAWLLYGCSARTASERASDWITLERLSNDELGVEDQTLGFSVASFAPDTQVGHVTTPLIIVLCDVKACEVRSSTPNHCAMYDPPGPSMDELVEQEQVSWSQDVLQN